MTNASRRLSWLTLVAVLTTILAMGCVPALPQKVREPERSVPTSFGETAGDTRATPVEWRTFFADPNLTALIETALANNQELNLVIQENFIARMEVDARRGEYLPRVDVRAGAGIEKVGSRTSQGVSDEFHEVPEHLQDYVLGFFASWEVDVWKKLRNATKAARLRYLASVEAKNFLVTGLVAEIAASYFELVALDNELLVLQQNIELQQKALEVMRIQKAAARVTELAVKRFEAEVLKNQSRQYSTRQEIIETENRINFLVGRFPRRVVRSSESFLQQEPTAIQSGIPSQLLENRPDIRRAELELAAAKLDVKVARARFYPSVEISAGVGYQAYEAGRLFATPGSLLYRAFADIVAPLVNRKGLTANYFVKNAQQMQAVLQYERTVLSAYIEAANQLAMVENLAKSYELRSQEVEKLNQSIEISSGLFRSARADYVEVLLTRREALASQMELIETKKEQMTAMVNLYRALGGGWK